MASTSSSHQQTAFSGIEPPNKRRKVEESSRLFDVFINHRGPDVKLTLAAQLYNSLKDLHIKVFLDSEEKKLGDSFPSTIETAIRSAPVHIAIFSKNYAESAWCLAELVLMLQSKAKIIPLFYQVEPWELRQIEKGVYADAFRKYVEKGRYLDKIEEWKNALQQVSYTAGYEYKSSDDCKYIVSAVEEEVKRTKLLHVAKYPVGLHKVIKDFERRCLDELVQDFESQCGMKTTAKKMVGIFGMGGVGKTTLSKELFNQKRSTYTQASFLFDVREACATGKLASLQSKLLKDIFCEDRRFQSSEEGTSCLRDCLERSSHDIDIDHVGQLDALLIMDIACFFIGKSINKAMTIWKGSGWRARHALETLKEKCLVEEVEVSHLNWEEKMWESSVEVSALGMHDHLRDLGREMANELSHPRRVWHPQHLRSLELKGFRSILAQTKARCFNSFLDKSFTGCKITYFLGDSSDGSDTSLLWLELDYRSWWPLDLNSDLSIFSWILLQNLLCLRISNWCFQKLWQSDVQAPSNLEELQIHGTLLEEITDLTRMKTLNCLKIFSCEKLQNIMLPTTLNKLDVQSCRDLKRLAAGGDLTKLTRLIIKKCPALEELSCLSRVTCFEVIEIFSCEKLQNIMLPTTLNKLDVQSCRDLKRLAAGGDLTKLTWLIIKNCPALEELSCLSRVTCPEVIEFFSCEKLQNIMLATTLNKLDVQSCRDLKRLAAGGDLTKLTRLFIKRCPTLEELSCLSRVTCLEVIEIFSCEKLQNIMLPTALNKLDVQSCRDLNRLAAGGDLTKLTRFIIKKCPALEELSCLYRVTCLEVIEIYSCEKLQNISDVESCVR